MRCSKCDRTDVEFERCARKIRSRQCRNCRREALKSWRKRNPDKVAAQKARLRAKPEQQEKARACSKRRWANPESRRRCTEAHYRRLADPVAHAHDLAQKRRYAYGVSEEEYKELLRRYNYACGICHRKDVRLGIDHDHATGQIRGILCLECNWALGLFRDSAATIRAAIGYLSKR